MSLPRPASWLSVLLLATACASDPSAPDAAMPAGSGSAREAITATIEAIVAGGRFDGELWRLNLSERCQSEVVAVGTCVDGDSILVEDADRQLHSIDRARGVHRYIVALPGRITQTVGGTSDAITAVSTDDLVAVSRKHGARVMPRPSNHLEFFPSGRAVTIGDTAYVGRLAPYSLQALDLPGGRAGWAYPVSGPVVDVLSYGDGSLAQVIGATEDGLVFSLPSRPAVASAWAPPENWHLRLPAARITTPLVASGTSLVFGADDGFLHHLDVRSGQIRWKAGCGHDMRGFEATLAGGAVYQRSDDGLHAFDLESGRELWTTAGSRVITRVGDRVYVDRGETVAVLAAGTGTELASFPSFDLSMPTVQGGGMLIATDGTNLFAIE